VAEAWHGEAVVAHEERIYPARLPGFVALEDGCIVGHASYRGEGDRFELTSITAEPQHAGIGSALLNAVLAAARAAGCRVVWLTTTNDNLDAIRFYQRRGFRLCALRRGAVDDARQTLKPELPQIGSYGIAMRDELDLELDLAATGVAAQ
jgi:ribosomal protein S18 acetylase RimI-like enzyme